jgi:hypothetical protein
LSGWRTGVEAEGEPTLEEEREPAVTCPFNRRSRLWLLLAEFALFSLLVGSFAVSCGGTIVEQRAEKAAEDDDPQATVEHPSLGDQGAPVVMTEYADFQ